MNVLAEQAGIDQPHTPWRGAMLDVLVLAFTLACGVAATWYAYSAAETTRTRQLHEQFNAAGQSVVDSFYLDLVRSVEGVHATALMVANQDGLSREMFARFAKGITANAPTLRALQWQPLVRGDNLAALETAARKDGLIGYRVVQFRDGQVVPAPPGDLHTPVLFAYPGDSVQLGLDFSQTPDYRLPQQLASETGQPVASAMLPISTAQGYATQTNGVLVSSAVFARGRASSDSPETVGYVAGLIEIEALFREAAFRADAASMDLLVFDQASEPIKLVYSAGSAPDKAANANADTSDSTEFDVRLTVDVASRPWEVVLRPRAHLLNSLAKSNSRLSLWGGGGATALLLLAIFITQRSRRTTARLQANSQAAEQRLSRIIEGTQAGTWEWHVPSGKRVINEHWAGMLGYTPAELDVSDVRNWLKLLHPDDRKVITASMAAHLRGETPTYECEVRARHKRGHWVWISSRAAIVSRSADGEPEWVAGTHPDISESKRLVQQMADVRTALDAHAIVGITDASGTITYANDKFCEVSGYSRAELLGNNHRILNSGFHTTAFFEAMWDTITHGRTWRGELRNRAKDGHVYWVDTTIAPILDEGGLPEHYIAIRYDITERIDSAAKLQAAKESAEAASRAKSDFLATMSHEIRTPMNGILGMLKLLQHTGLSTQQLDYTRKAHGAAQALLGIINDILDFSKVEAGKLELDPIDFALGDVLRDLAVLLSASAGNKEIEVLISLDPKVPRMLRGDALRLQQVLLNLCGNAIKFTEHGHVMLRVDAFSVSAESSAIGFSVEDSGIGISPDKLDYIFEGFSQAESSTTRRFGGTGLGLAICKRLVSAMGGDLQVQSQPGVGSRFFFTLNFPVVHAAASAVDSALTTLKEPSALRVLVVDDSPMAREVLQTMVTSMGWECTCLEGGAAALAHLADPAAPDYGLVLMDWRMPGLDGWETIRRIRQLQRGGQAPVVIMVTAAGREALAARPKADTDLLDGYLVKPLTASMLFDAVTEAAATRSGQPDSSARHSHPQDALRKLQGLRLLVVEDNLLNQQIAQELLELNGATVDIAGGGIDGVAQALAAEPAFDAILMDIQMPDIDGLEATRQIRLQPRMQAVPIIAMTANAMQSDKEACLAAGMVDHVGKPIDLALLIATLLRHTSPTAQPSVTRRAPSEPVQAELNTVAPQPATLLELDAAIKRLGGSRAFFDKIARAFRTDAAAQLAALHQQMASGDRQGALRSAHTFKGLAATVGASALAQLAAQTESQIKALDEAGSGGLEQAGRLLTSLEVHFANVLLELGAITQPEPLMPARQPASVTTVVVAYAQLLPTLQTLLKTGNMRAIEVCADIRRDFAPHLDARFDALEQAVNSLDFASALERCTDLLKPPG